MDLSYFLPAALAVWRVTHLLHAEAGTGRALVSLRGWARRHPIGRMLSSFAGLSLWVAAPAALLLGPSWLERGLLWLGLSALAMLLDRVTARHSTPAAAAAGALSLPRDDELDSDFPVIQLFDGAPLQSATP